MHSEFFDLVEKGIGNLIKTVDILRKLNAVSAPSSPVPRHPCAVAPRLRETAQHQPQQPRPRSEFARLVEAMEERAHAH
jgi:hypothetical protein